ncbi:MAG: ABC transporter substrate-binding protein [Myxococcota bacterium]|nr:ABC transporter substrate-binding protein [Myxococcota bacterium]
MKLRSLGLVVLVLGSTVSCTRPNQQVKVPPPDGAGPERPKPPSADEETQAQAASAQGKSDEVLQRYPGTSAAADIYIARGRAAEAANKTDEAITNYEKLLYYRPTHPGVDAIREPYAKLLIQAGRHADAATVLQPMYKNGASADQARLASMLAEALRGSGQGARAVELYVDLKNQQAALDTVASGLSVKDSERVWKDHQSDPAYEFLHAAMAFKLAKMYLHVRDYEHANEMAQLVTSRFGTSPYAAQAQTLIDGLKARSRVNPKVIGAVLPLSGKFQQYGERAAKALDMALTRAGFELVVKDSKGDPLLAGKAVEELVLKNNAIAVIGDMFSAPALAAAQKAEELGVPILSLSYAEGIPEVGSYTFRAALTVEAQAKGLVKVAMEQMGMQRFALFYPRTSYGVAFTTAFWREVEAKGGEIRGAQPYDYDQTTFSEPASKLVGRYYRGARHDYYTSVQELRDQGLTGQRLQSAIEKAEKNLKPVVDFDAIVIPDGATNLGLIAPALAYEDIVMEHDQRRLEKMRKATNDRNLKPITLMGGSTWNTPQVVEKCERYCEQSIFVDGFYAASTDARVRDFVSGFREKTGAEPVLSDAQAYDAAGVLVQIMGSGQVTDREALRRALESFPGYPGVTGTLKFDTNGETMRDPFVLTIEDQTIQVWHPPKPQG